MSHAVSFNPDFLLRSWYRWGEPSEEKVYTARKDIVSLARDHKIGVGGGASLSVVNEYDLRRADFDPSWLSVDLRGSPTNRNGRKSAALSSPGFRKYLVNRLLEQVSLGISEIHLGESNGEIHFDDWTLGLKGDVGFIQWLREKYTNQSLQWWTENFGSLGRRMYEKSAVDRSTFLNLSPSQRTNFEREFGNLGSWRGNNNNGLPAFLSYKYRLNLENFLSELSSELARNGYTHVTIDVWGFADWMPMMSVQPNAYISTPPDERWGLNWSTDSTFDLVGNRERIIAIMEKQVNSVKPVPVVYMIDHPKPFDDFKKLPDERQAEITEFFSDISREVGANFVFRSYSRDRSFLGPRTDRVINAQCQQRKVHFCPTGK